MQVCQCLYFEHVVVQEGRTLLAGNPMVWLVRHSSWTLPGPPRVLVQGILVLVLAGVE